MITIYSLNYEAGEKIAKRETGECEVSESYPVCNIVL